MLDWLKGGGKKRRGPDSLGMLAVRQIADSWMIDADHIRWVDDGFDWWPGSFRVEVRAHSDADSPGRCRVTVKTNYLQNIPAVDPRFELLASGFGMFASSYSFVREGNDGGDLSLFSSAYVNANLMGWLPQLFGALAILQPIDAEIRAAAHAEMVGAAPAYGGRGKVKAYDDLLELVQTVYAPAGAMPSWWSGAEEFHEFDDELLVAQDVAINNDDDYLALDVPLGNGTARARLQAAEGHPQLGNGLLVTLAFPSPSGSDISKLAALLNQAEAANWTNFAQLGCWYSRHVDDELTELAHTSFVPNALAREGLASNFAYWSVARARWAHNLLQAPASSLVQ
jgi:hypothetical protein